MTSCEWWGVWDVGCSWCKQHAVFFNAYHEFLRKQGFRDHLKANLKRKLDQMLHIADSKKQVRV